MSFYYWPILIIAIIFAITFERIFSPNPLRNPFKKKKPDDPPVGTCRVKEIKKFITPQNVLRVSWVVEKKIDYSGYIIWDCVSDSYDDQAKAQEACDYMNGVPEVVARINSQYVTIDPAAGSCSFSRGQETFMEGK